MVLFFYMFLLYLLVVVLEINVFRLTLLAGHHLLQHSHECLREGRPWCRAGAEGRGIQQLGSTTFVVSLKRSTVTTSNTWPIMITSTPAPDHSRCHQWSDKTSQHLHFGDLSRRMTWIRTFSTSLRSQNEVTWSLKRSLTDSKEVTY